MRSICTTVCSTGLPDRVNSRIASRTVSMRTYSPACVGCSRVGKAINGRSISRTFENLSLLTPHVGGSFAPVSTSRGRTSACGVSSWILAKIAHRASSCNRFVDQKIATHSFNCSIDNPRSPRVARWISKKSWNSLSRVWSILFAESSDTPIKEAWPWVDVLWMRAMASTIAACCCTCGSTGLPRTLKFPVDGACAFGPATGCPFNIFDGTGISTWWG